MKKHTDKELKERITDELEALQKQALEEFEQLGQQLEKQPFKNLISANQPVSK